MAFVLGRVSKILRDPDGNSNGMLLDDGQEIRFSAAFGHLVSPIITEGCLVGVKGDRSFEISPEGSLTATQIINLDSSETVTLPATTQEGKPGMQFKATPIVTTSLAHPAADSKAEDKSAPSSSASGREAFGVNLTDVDSKPLHPASFFHSLLRETNGRAPELSRNDAARSIGLAYDSLHRIQAILAYLHIIKRRVPGISQVLDEAKHTYEQALGRFADGEFASSKELAEASASLSRVVEIVIARTLRSDSTIPSLVPPPPIQMVIPPEPEHVEEDLARAESVLSRIHWVLKNGTLPSDDRAQVRKITSWGDAFYKQAQHTFRDAVLEDAAEFAQAALAGAYSAEHVCRKWYVSHTAHS
jgi:hypothetical protein